MSRQLIRTVALLYLDRGRTPFVTHVDVDHPAQPFAPDWWQQHDWLAGVRPLTHRFIGSIVEPAFMDDSVRIWERLQGESGDLREAYHAALLPQAHRCWSGEITCITRAGLIQQLRGADNAPTQARDQLIAWLEAGISDALANESWRSRRL